jgi:hypothetical protein
MENVTTPPTRKKAETKPRPARISGLTYSARKALTVHIGEKAGTEIADLIQQMAAEIEELRQTKVSITRIVPGGEPR